MDASLILQGRQPQFDNPMDLAIKGMTMKQLLNSNLAAERETTNRTNMDAVLKKNTMTDPSGNVSINHQGAINDMMKANPTQGMAMQDQFQGHDLAKLKSDSEAMQMLMASATPETGPAIKAQAIKLGITNADKLPDQWTPEIIKGVQSRTMTLAQQIDSRLKQSEITKNYAQASQAGNDLKISLQKAKLDQINNKRPPADVAVNLGSGGATVKALDELEKIYDGHEGVGTGTFAGSFLNPAKWGPSNWSDSTAKSKEYKAQRILAGGELAKYIHGGVPDAATVEHMTNDVIPDLSDTKEVKAAKFERAKEMVKARAEEINKNLLDAGYNTSNMSAPDISQKTSQPPQVNYAPDVLQYAKANGVTPQQAQIFKDSYKPATAGN